MSRNYFLKIIVVRAERVLILENLTWSVEVQVSLGHGPTGLIVYLGDRLPAIVI